MPVGFFGAGEGNRTLTTSLEGWDSTIELHPHIHNNRYITTKPPSRQVFF